MEDRQENLLPSSSPNLQPLSIDEELWLMAEERAQEILCTIQPNLVSEANRKEVIDYVQGLIKGQHGAEVFVFGSSPLKTYLPDGDIDLTALSHGSTEDLAHAVLGILESRDDHRYQVKDIQYIPAQVQVVKCTVKNIAVDISFNQMAGLYALRFLEQIDELVGKNHLFKRSIILVKAWCYYESRILGAHHGLLSTYAVETLVLYIINRFHSSMRGPLEVLYRFLDYYGNFNWDTDYASIDGPKSLSSLPEIVETPDCQQGELLLSKEFVKMYRDMCSVSAMAKESTTPEFPTKHLNIMDPLRNDNNIGRSVSKGNLHRIKFALSFGARRLKGILKLPGESMGAALEKFFMNTLERNGKGQRADVDVPVPAFGTGRSEEPVLRGDCESYYGALQYTQFYHNYVMPHTALPSSPSSTSQADIHALLTQQNWGMIYQMATDFQSGTALPSSPSSTSQADIHALSTQQNWSMFYPTGTDCQIGTDLYAHYFPTQADIYGATQADIYGTTQTLYHPNVSLAPYCFDENGRSRGTGTYIPDVTHNSYWDMRVKVSKPRRFPPGNHNVFSKSPQRKQLMEVPSETDMNDNKSKSFELSNEEFPLLPSFRKTSPAEAQESVPLTYMSEQDRNSSSSQLNINFGTYGKELSLTELSLPTKGEKEDFGVSSSKGTSQVVPRVAMERKKEVPESNVKMD